MEPYLTFDVISARYKDKGTSLMTSQWRFRPRSPLSLLLRYDLVTLCLYGDLGQINVIARILKLRKRFRMSQILFEHGINSLPPVFYRGYGGVLLGLGADRVDFPSYATRRWLKVTEYGKVGGESMCVQDIHGNIKTVKSWPFKNRILFHIRSAISKLFWRNFYRWSEEWPQ